MAQLLHFKIGNIGHSELVAELAVELPSELKRKKMSVFLVRFLIRRVRALFTYNYYG
jgi:hypothetical protein